MDNRGHVLALQVLNHLTERRVHELVCGEVEDPKPPWFLSLRLEPDQFFKSLDMSLLKGYAEQPRARVSYNSPDGSGVL